MYKLLHGKSHEVHYVPRQSLMWLCLLFMLVYSCVTIGKVFLQCVQQVFRHFGKVWDGQEWVNGMEMY